MTIRGTTFCDRCGEANSSMLTPGWAKISLPIQPEFRDTMGTPRQAVDLCERCTASLRAWWMAREQTHPYAQAASQT